MSEVWKPKDRAIYRYANGERDANGEPIIVSVDPYKVLSQFQQVEGFDVEIGIVSSYAAPLKERGKSWDFVCKSIREIFKIGEPLFDKEGNAVSGLLDEECVELLTHFRLSMGELKKNMPSSPISSSNTDPASLDGNSATKNTLDSSSIAIVRSSDEQQPVQSESA